MPDIKTKVIEIIADCFQIDPTEISLELAAGDIPQWDSVGHINLIATIEDRLKIEFPVEELFDLNSVQAIVTSVENILGAQ